MSSTMAPVATSTSTVPATCLDVTEANDQTCFGNVTWAMETGIKAEPMWYADYPVLSESGSFSAYQYVLALKTGPGGGAEAGKGWRCPYPCNFQVPTCTQITQLSPGLCYKNLLWAKETGINTNPEFYAAFPGLTNQSALEDFQYALHEMIYSNESVGWQCPMPCTSMFIPTTTSTTTYVATTVTSTTMMTTTTTTLKEGSGFPWWAWALVILGVLALIAAAAAAFMMSKPKKQPESKKSTRAGPIIPPPPPAPAPAPEPAPAPAPEPERQALIAKPVYTATTQHVTTAPPVYSARAQPVMTAPPVYTSAPVVTTAQPVQAVQTVQTVAMPVAQPVTSYQSAVPAYSMQAPYTYN